MSHKTGTVINPYTGRRIKVGGRTYRKLQVQDGGGGDSDNIGKTVQDLQRGTDDYYASLLEKAKGAPIPTAGITDTRSKYALIPSNMPPSPETHSWYHHHAPMYQTFGDYVCVDRSVLRQLGSLLHDTLGTK